MCVRAPLKLIFIDLFVTLYIHWANRFDLIMISIWTPGERLLSLVRGPCTKGARGNDARLPLGHAALETPSTSTYSEY